MARNKSRLRGVPLGYEHGWNYKRKLFEKKLSHNKWIGHAVGTKTKIKPTSYMGLAKIGSSFLWKWNMFQRTTKLSRNKYRTRSVFTKRLLKEK